MHKRFETSIVIGVTGHRDLRKRDIPRLRELVASELKKLAAQYPDCRLVLLDSLASGADTLCAEVALELGMELVCPLPMPVEEYRRDFTGADAAAFDALIERAAEVFTAPYSEQPPEHPTRDFHYRQAGIYVAKHSRVLLALWDGLPPKPEGCGTAETVGFMLRGDYEGQDLIKPYGGAVIHILTPRQGTEGEISLCVRLIEKEPRKAAEKQHEERGENMKIVDFSEESEGRALPEYARIMQRILIAEDALSLVEHLAERGYSRELCQFDVEKFEPEGICAGCPGFHVCTRAAARQRQAVTALRNAEAGNCYVILRDACAKLDPMDMKTQMLYARLYADIALNTEGAEQKEALENAMDIYKMLLKLTGDTKYHACVRGCGRIHAGDNWEGREILRLNGAFGDYRGE